MPTSTSTDLRRLLQQQLAANAYPGYVYGYPHKKAYRLLDPPRSLTEVWAGEDRNFLFCYVHLPFCSQRCSFCNLFTQVPADHSPVTGYLDALAREMDACAAVLAPMRFQRLYLGGGTPTFLSGEELSRLVRHLRDTLGVGPAQTNGCIEASPETLNGDKADRLCALGFQRLSLGVQSFVEAELRQVNRRFPFALHHQAIAAIASARFPHFNIDLIYGLPGQTRASWRYSLDAAIDTPATSLFLYPLYVRPLTGLSARRHALDAPAAPTLHEMAAMYDVAVERLSAAGFRQRTMRQFLRGNAPADDEYRCQEHGMVGLGAGARSYTSVVHYSTPWRMVAKNIRAVIDDYQRRMARGDTAVTHGFVLDDDERRRRFVIQSLLYDGVDTGAFAANVRARFAPVWEALHDEGCIVDDGTRIRLTPLGRRHADVVGGLFFSPRVLGLIDAYEYDA